MNKNYKNLLSVFGTAVFLIFLAAFQISFINPTFLNLNLFLILILYLVLTKNDSKAIIFSWIGGVLTGLIYFSNFGVHSLVLLILAALLIVIRQAVFLNLKTESIAVISVIGVALYHFLNWVLINLFALLKIGAFENLGAHFAGWAVLTELILTALILLLIFKIKGRNA